MSHMSWFVHLGAYQWFGTYKTSRNVNIVLSSIIAKASSGIKTILLMNWYPLAVEM